VTHHSGKKLVTEEVDQMHLPDPVRRELKFLREEIEKLKKKSC
jgi:hypothetical protein